MNTPDDAARTAYEERTGDTTPRLYVCRNDDCPGFDHDIHGGAYRQFRRMWEVPTRWDEIENPENENCPTCGRKGEPE